MAAEKNEPLLIKRYASRRLYNTETSDYVTLEDIADLIRTGRDVQIIDLKTGDDLTRQYLLQIVAENEARGGNVLPVEVLTDLVRSYATGMQSILPEFLANSFEMLRQNQARMVESLTSFPNPMASLPGFEALQKQQQMFLETMMRPAQPGQIRKPAPATGAPDTGSELAEIKKQLAELQAKLAKF